MPYIQNNLLNNEKIILAVRPHWIIFSSGCWAIAFAIYIGYFAPHLLDVPIYNRWDAYYLIAVALGITGCYWLIQAYIAFLTSEYGVTDKRVIMKVGWIRRKSLEIMIEKVEGVLVDQSVIGRIFDYGAVSIIGTGGTTDQFAHIPNPLLFRRTVQQQIDQIELSQRQKNT